MADSFDIFDRPFVTWRRGDGTSDRFGLKSLLKEAATLSPFSDHGPQTTFAVIRVVLVLIHRTGEEYQDKWEELWKEGQFPGDWIAKIEKAAEGKFDLFHPKRPFYQRAGADADAADEAKDKSASYLIPEFAAGTNITFASHTYDDHVALCPACCARGLLQLPPFCGAGGSGLMASINNTPPVYFLPVGPNLFHTLLLNWPLADRVPGDHPLWEPGKPPARIGILEGFTWEPRTVRLFPVDGDQSCTNCGDTSRVVVRRVVFSKGVPASRERLAGWRDPHVHYDEVAVGRKTQVRALTPPEPDKRPAAALGFWRKEIAALLRMPTAADDGRGCRVVDAASGRRAGEALTVSCVVPFTRPGQDKKHLVRSDTWTLPPLDAGQVDVLLAELNWIDLALGDWAERVEAKEHAVPEIAPLAEFERRSEVAFRGLLAGDVSPVVWRQCVQETARQLTQSRLSPGRALEAARTRRVVKEAIDAAFPLTPKEVPT